MKVKITLLLALTLLFSLQGRAQCNGATFEEENGIVVIQAESGNLSGSWQRQSSFSGYTGNSYIVWTGRDYFNEPGNGVINYTVRINSPGIYRFNWRSRVGIGNEFTEHNDSWLRIQGAADFYGVKGNSIVYPKGSGKSPTPEGSGGGGWFKVYLSGTSDWTWSTKTSDNDGHDIFARFDSPGNYTIQVSARSRGHLIDRMVLYKVNTYSASQARNTSLQETRCGGSTNPPPPPPDDGGDTGGGDSGGGGTGGNDSANSPPTVNITSPAEGQNIAVGSNVRIELTASDSDGSITRHQIFVNGTRVDLDGSNYTPHVISNISAGSYVIRALVTDNNGAKAESTVTITVDGSGGDTGGGDTGGGDTGGGDTGGGDTGGGDTGGGDTGGGDTGGGSGDPMVTITNPADGENFSAGDRVRVELVASDPDGNIVRHRIFVNGTLVDTDGSGYTPHVIRNIENGDYTIRAVVTDNSGNQAESTVNFTVGSTTGSGGNDAGSGDSGSGGGTPPPANNVTFYLINANTDQVVRSVEPGINIQFGEARNFQATTTVAGVVSARIQLSGALTSTRIESVAPYAAFGDVNGDYIPANLPDGNYTLTATFYSGGNGSGAQLASRSVSFSVGSGSNSGKTVVDLAKVVVYPNPVPDGQVTVKLPVPLQSTYAYQLMAPNGQIVDYGVKENGSASDTSSLYLKGLEQSQEGIYYLTLTDGVHTFSVPVVKK